MHSCTRAVVYSYIRSSHDVVVANASVYSELVRLPLTYASPRQSKDKTFLFRSNYSFHFSCFFQSDGHIREKKAEETVVSLTPFCPYRRVYARLSQGPARSGFTNSKGLISVCSKLCATLPRKIDAAPLRRHGHASRVQLLSLLPHQCHTTACSTWHRSDNASREASGLANATMKL